jgi:hypothetical protein
MLYIRQRAPRRAAKLASTLVIAALSAAACRDARVPPTAPGPGRIAITSGDAQRGAPGQALDEPIVIVVRDDQGEPATGVRVSWIADDGGRIDPPESVTSSYGIAMATWTLGADRALHHGRALAPGYATVEFTATTPPDVELPLDVIQPLTLETYDGSGQSVHPDYVATGPEWTRGGNYLLLTPYPKGNPAFENPAIYQSRDLVSWTTPFGAPNPLTTPTGGYFSDPDALFVPERNELWVYFREVTTANRIRLTTSVDGVHWSASTLVAEAPNHAIISPTVVRRSPNEWLMWSVNGNVGCAGATTTVELRRSVNGVLWSNPETVALTQPGLSVWHIDVQWIPSRREYWALYNTKTAGTCTTAAVYLATSADGVHWTTHPSPVLSHGATPDLQDVIYRSTFAYEPATDEVTLWYSGARYDGASYVWHSAVQRRRRVDLFASIGAQGTAVVRAERPLPPLVNFP